VSKTQSPMLTAALLYADGGFSVFPVTTEALPDGKKKTQPLTQQGLLDATNDEQTIREWWTENPGAGIGLLPASVPGTVVVDADDSASSAFVRDLLGGDPTVLTPSAEGDGHGGGGHWYVSGVDPTLLSDLEVKSPHAQGLSVELIGAGAGRNFVFAPPTVRIGRDQPYRIAGPTYSTAAHPKFIEWLRGMRDAELAAQAAREAAKAARAGSSESTENLDDWMRDQSWSQLLTEDGWLETGNDGCECPIFQHPWGASSEKSATAHGEGCPKADSDFPGGTLHLWSENAVHQLGGDVSMSKFGYVTHARHGGDYGLARREEGIPSDVSADVIGLDEVRAIRAEAAMRAEQEAKQRGEWGMIFGTSTGLLWVPDRRASGVDDTADSDDSGDDDTTADDGWIRTEAQCKAAGWGTPRPLLDSGKVDASFDPWNRDVYPLGHPAAPDLIQRVFDFNDVTRAIFERARLRNPVPTGPFGLLSVELVRAGLRIDTAFEVFPGTPVSIACLRFGGSGKGKSVAMAKRAKWQTRVPFFGGTLTRPSEAELDTHTVMGSGEAVVRLFCDLVTEEDPTDRRKSTSRWVQKPWCTAWIEEAEFEGTLDRQERGSTFFPMFNAAWAGENPIAETKAQAKPEMPNPFTLFLTGGAQTTLWPTIKAMSTGFPQRVLKVGVSDPWRDRPQDVLVQSPPAGFALPPMHPNTQRAGTFTIAASGVQQALARSASLSAYEATASDDGAATHIIQVRIRIACVAAALFGGYTVTDEIWEWSGYVIEHHRRVTAWLDAIEEAEKAKDRKARGAELGDVDAARKAQISKGTQKAREVVIEVIATGGGAVTKRELERGVPKSLHPHLWGACEQLMKSGAIEIVSGKRRDQKIIRFPAPESANN